MAEYSYPDEGFHRVMISTTLERKRRWRAAAERDPRLAVLPSGRRLSAFIRLEIDAAVERFNAAEVKSSPTLAG